MEKRFSSFRIFAEYADGTTPKCLPIRHSVPPTICVVLPQLGFLAAVWLIAVLLAHSLNAEKLSQINSATTWLRILIVGPYSISFAMSTPYPKFRFRAYALRIAPS